MDQTFYAHLMELLNRMFGQHGQGGQQTPFNSLLGSIRQPPAQPQTMPTIPGLSQMFGNGGGQGVTNLMGNRLFGGSPQASTPFPGRVGGAGVFSDPSMYQNTPGGNVVM